MLHVIDASALLALAQCVSTAVYNDILNDLTDLVREGDLTFPKEVADDLQHRAKGETLDVWIKAVASDRLLKAVPFANVQWVMAECSDLLDPDALIDSPTQVAAFGRELARTDSPFHVVTDDIHDKPTRLALSTACATFGWHAEDVRGFLECVGLDGYLVI